MFGKYITLSNILSSSNINIVKHWHAIVICHNLNIFLIDCCYLLYVEKNNFLCSNIYFLSNHFSPFYHFNLIYDVCKVHLLKFMFALFQILRLNIDWFAFYNIRIVIIIFLRGENCFEDSSVFCVWVHVSQANLCLNENWIVLLHSPSECMNERRNIIEKYSLNGHVQ